MPKIEVNNEKPNLVEAGILKCWETNAIMSKVYQADGISPTVPSGKNKNNAPKIEIAGTIDNGSVQNGIIYDTDGISPTIVASAQDHGNHVRIIDPKIEIAGKMADTNVEQAKRVYGTNGIAPTISAGGGTGSIAKVEVKGHLAGNESSQHFRVYDPNGIAPTLSACDSKDPTKIEVSKDD